jgi:hypothetical protein
MSNAVANSASINRMIVLTQNINNQ